MSWGNDVEDPNESEEQEESTAEVPDFPKTLEKATRGDGSPNDIEELQYANHLEEVEDTDLLREAWLQLKGEKKKLVRNRIESLDGDVPDGEDGDESEETEEESGDESEDSSSWGGSPENEVAEEAEDSIEDAEPSVETVEEMEDEDEGEEEETGGEAVSSTSGPPTPESAFSVDEMAEQDRRWKLMVWGPSKLFKTHFGYTMPEPIAIIDTENKADDLAKKFAGKEIQIWQPKTMEANPDTRFRRAKKALNEAFEWLEWYAENEGEIGSIVIDSMTDIWQWAQRHHKIENYPLKDTEEVELSANFQSSQESDWAVVKEYHNGEFRDKIIDSQFHFYWSARERVSFEETFEEEDNRQVMEPKGEPDNDYHADTIIHAREDKDRGKVGDLTGSNFVDNKFVGLKKPTFPTVRDAIETIAEAEASDEKITRSELAKEVGAEAIIDYDPQRYE